MNTSPLADRHDSTASNVPGRPRPPLGRRRDAAIADFLDRFASDCQDRDVLADLWWPSRAWPATAPGRGDLSS